MKGKEPEYKYKFSVIIPIYNVEDYLRETIESVIHQTIGFKKNIQMILVNDGSPDNSEAICLEYKEKYPDNIVYVKQQNAGVSAARNKGIQYIQGKYVNFLDSDDKWDLNVFKEVYHFFEKHYNEINVVGCRIRFFGARRGFHPLDFTFKDGTRVVDINKEYSAIHIHNATCFLKAKILNDYRFNTNLKYAEDSLFLTNIIIEDQKYGLIKEAIYNYRKRKNDLSAVQKKIMDIDWYTKTIDENYFSLIQKSKRNYQKVIPYIQYMIMYDIQWRMKENIPQNILDMILVEYRNKLKSLLENIEDRIIIEQKSITREFKIQLLNIKYGRDIRDELRYEDDGCVFFNDIFITNTSKRALRIDVLETDNEYIYIAGRFSSILKFENYQLYVETNGKRRYNIELFEMLNGNITDAFGNIIMKRYGFKIQIPVKGTKRIIICMKYKDHTPKKLTMHFNRMGKLNTEHSECYYSNQKSILWYSHNILHVEKNTKRNKVGHELKYWGYLFKKIKLKVIGVRLCYCIARAFKKKPIWLVSDRTVVANDNGMHLFKYISSQGNNEIKTYFVLDKNSKDYKNMKKIGKVLRHNTFLYKLKFLLSDKIISSQADDSILNAFGRGALYYKDLYKYQFVFLQHGITKDDISSWLNYFDKNIKLFVTATPEEYNSILQGNYYYDNNTVKLTGFPRYDNLKDRKNKIIAIMPTWRKKDAGEWDAVKGVRKYNSNFKKSGYFQFYHRLINDKRLILAMKKRGYKGIFVVHPSHMENYKDFKSNWFDIAEEYADYQEIFGKASLLVSDYSSVPFDFAYLKKPVIYTQFDRDEFFTQHTYTQGYFSYEDDGFGPVCYNYDDTVNEIIKMIENDCKMEEKYLQRVENFYQYHDRNNCKRVYEEILKLK